MKQGAQMRVVPPATFSLRRLRKRRENTFWVVAKAWLRRPEMVGGSIGVVCLSGAALLYASSLFLSDEKKEKKKKSSKTKNDPASPNAPPGSRRASTHSRPRAQSFSQQSQQSQSSQPSQTVPATPPESDLWGTEDNLDAQATPATILEASIRETQRAPLPSETQLPFDFLFSQRPKNDAQDKTVPDVITVIEEQQAQRDKTKTPKNDAQDEPVPDFRFTVIEEQQAQQDETKEETQSAEPDTPEESQPQPRVPPTMELTYEWQEVPEGYAVPAGQVENRMDLSTGKNYARLIPKVSGLSEASPTLPSIFEENNPFQYVVTINSHGMKREDTLNLPDNVYVLIPHVAGLKEPYKLSPGPDGFTFEDFLYLPTNEAMLLPHFVNGEWMCYRPHDTMPNLTLLPNRDEPRISKSDSVFGALMSWMRGSNGKPKEDSNVPGIAFDAFQENVNKIAPDDAFAIVSAVYSGNKEPIIFDAATQGFVDRERDTPLSKSQKSMQQIVIVKETTLKDILEPLRTLKHEPKEPTIFIPFTCNEGGPEDPVIIPVLYEALKGPKIKDVLAKPPS